MAVRWYLRYDHGGLKSRLRPMRGLRQFRSVRMVSAGHSFIQNLCRGHDELATHLDLSYRHPAAFGDLILDL